MDSGDGSAIDFCIFTNCNISLKNVKFGIEVIYVLNCDAQQPVSGKGNFSHLNYNFFLGKTPRHGFANTAL